VVALAATQTPTPSQLRVAVNDAPTHVAPAHWVAALYNRQAPFPSHLPSVLHMGAPLSAQRCWESSPPSGTAEHLPRLPATAQDMQVPAQAVLQQTPCAHVPVLHSPSAPHVLPMGFLPQLPLTQTFPVEQFELTVQLIRQVPLAAAQLKGAQSCVLPGWQAPWPLQRLASVWVAPAHEPAPQMVPVT
jgi:hypothetical protein